MLKSRRILFATSMLGLLLLATGCQHRLVAAHGETGVAVYPDEQTYQKIANLKKQGGMAGMLGGLGENFTTKQMDDKTPIRIISSDDAGSVVVVTDGPNKGFKGFVPKSNVN